MIIDELFEGPQLCPECGGISFSDLILAEKKDACYYKVKASAKVWPSAYASGRLVQCRKKGAANYGKSKTEGVAEATGDEKFDTMMGRIQQEPKYPDPQMPPTDVKDLYQWAVKNNKPYHKIFAEWANREGFKSVAPALHKAGTLDSDALDYWTPDVWKVYWGEVRGIDSEMPPEWAKQRIPDELRDYLETVFDAYDHIVFDWPTEYRQIGQQGMAEQQELDEKWSQKYKNSINCANPRGFSQRAHCAGRKKNEDIEETRRGQIPMSNLKPGETDNYEPEDIEGYKKLPQYQQGYQAQQKAGKTLLQQSPFTFGSDQDWAYRRGAFDAQQAAMFANFGKSKPLTTEEGEQQKGADYRDPKEVDYDDEYDAMVARVKKLAGLGPLKTVYDPTKRVYRNMPTAVQPKK